jgi:hypothetical protein
LFPASVFVSSIPAPAQTFLLVTGGSEEDSGNLRFFNFHLKRQSMRLLEAYL